MNKIGDCFQLTNRYYGRVTETYMKIMKFKMNHIVFECYAAQNNFVRSEVVIPARIHNIFLIDSNSYMAITSDEYSISRIR